MSTHEVLVVKITSVNKHPAADNLELITVEGYDYSIISKAGQFVPDSLGVYIEPDYVVPTDRPEFAFLTRPGRSTHRITNVRLRGIWSDGLLIPAKPEHTLGQNVIEEYGITRWEPPPQKNSRSWGNEGSDLQSCWAALGPTIVSPKYDLENYRKYSALLSLIDYVYLTVKIHGSNLRAVFSSGEMYCGSRTTWKCRPGTVIVRENTRTGEKFETIAPENSWWKALEQNPWIEEWCRNNPDCVVYGEVFGPDIQGSKFHYGYTKGNLGLRIFDVLENREWISFNELYNTPRFEKLKLVPVLYQGPFDKEMVYEVIEQNENMFDNIGDGHIREGVVIKLKDERIDPKIGRVALKCVSRNYLQRS